MKKINKKILFISDNFDKSYWKLFKEDFSKGNYYYDKNSNWLSFTPKLIKNIVEAKEIKKGEYDIILVDYSLFGDTKYNTKKELIENVKIVEELYFKCEYLFLQGVMAKHFIKNDTKNFLSGFEIIPKLKIVDFKEDELLYDLYNLIEKPTKEVKK